MAHSNLFGKPGHGAPTKDIRKKKFTEYQLQAGPGMPPAGGSGSDYVGDAVANPVDFVSSSSLPNPYRPPQPQMDDGIAYQPRPPGSSINPYMNGHNGSLNGLNGGGQMTQAEMVREVKKYISDFMIVNHQKMVNGNWKLTYKRHAH